MTVGKALYSVKVTGLFGLDPAVTIDARNPFVLAYVAERRFGRSRTFAAGATEVDLSAEVAELDGTFLDAERWSTAELRDRVIRAAACGELLLGASERASVSSAPVPQLAPALSMPAAGVSEQEAWLEVELVDDDGSPYAGRVEIELADGDRITRSTNEFGLLRLDGIRPGTCTVRLVGLDPAAWDPA